MYYIARKIMFMASILRIAAVAAIAGAVAYGIYLIPAGQLMQGAIWIASALGCGIAGHILFGLVSLISSTIAGPVADGGKVPARGGSVRKAR